MKKFSIILLTTLIYNLTFGQSIAFMGMGNDFLDKAIVTNMKKKWLNAKLFTNSLLFENYNNSNLVSLSDDQIANLKMFNHDFIILHKSEKTGQGVEDYISYCCGLINDRNWQSEFYVFNVNTNQYTVISLAISTFDCGNKLKSCSNISGFVKQVKDFVQGGSSNVMFNENISITNKKSIFRSIFGSSSNSDGKFKVVRVKERNPSNNYPVAIDVFDKSQSLRVGDNINITRTDEVKISGERKIYKSETTIGKAKITEDFKPLYTAKLIANADFNMKDYKDGDENYNAVKGDVSDISISKPSIMVIPKMILASKWVDGEYQLTKEEKMLIAAFKNKFEDNKFTTYGFESVLKRVLENRQINDNVQDDIKSKILEASGIDFFVEYENLDQNNTKCDKVFDFKIRNYSTGEDVASDVKSLNSCGSPDDYKSFASCILNAGAIDKINTQFSSMLTNGRKVSIVFTISSTSQAKLNKEYNGVKLGVHINNCLQSIAFKGNLELESESDLRKSALVNIPIIDGSSGQKFQTTTFAEEISSYLKKYAGIECDKIVSRQVINFKIK